MAGLLVLLEGPVLGEPVDLWLWKKRGINPLIPSLRTINWRAGLMTGRQAETIPADISMAVQPTVGASVYVGSRVL